MIYGILIGIPIGIILTLLYAMISELYKHYENVKRSKNDN